MRNHLVSSPDRPERSSVPHRTGVMLQRCACGSATGSLTGECEECKKKKQLQAKLSVGAVNDPLEHEADRVADQVLSTPRNSALTPAPVRVQRAAAHAGATAGTVPASVDRVLASTGRPLDQPLRHDMEQRFGHDFSSVRVHSGEAAARSADDVSANAYTVGHDVVFGAGRYAPGTHDGRRLIAHELTHVLQQSSGASPCVIQRAPGDDKPPIGAPALPPASENLTRLAELLKEWFPVAEIQRTTTISRAAAIEVKTGRTVYLIAVAGEGAALPINLSILKPDEVFVPNTGEHAEIQTMKFAQKEGYKILPGALEPSRAFCQNCGWWAKKHKLAPPNATVRVGQKIKPLESVSLGELSKSVPAKKMPGAGGEPTPLGRAKRALKAPKVPPTRAPFMPRASGPVMPSPSPSPMSSHEGTRMPKPESPISAFERPQMPQTMSPMSAYERPGMPRPQSPMDAYQRFKSAGPLSPGAESTLGGSVGERGRVPAGRLAGGLLKSFAIESLVVAIIMTGLSLAWAWITYEKNVETKEERRLRKLLGSKVAPGVKQALEARSAEALKMTTDNPEFPVYANVTIDLVKEWTDDGGIAPHPSDKEIVDARFVDLAVSFKKVSREKTGDSDNYAGDHYRATTRVTYSVEIDFGETREERQARRLRHHAAEIARRKMSAESVAEGTHWIGLDLTPSEKQDDEFRRRWGYPTLAEQRAYDERELWVLAYIEHTAFYGPDDQYSAAVSYLEKIRRRPRPEPGPVLRGFPKGR